MKKISFYIYVKSIGLYLNLLSYINTKKALQITYKLFSNPRKGKLQIDNLPKTLQGSELEKQAFGTHEFYCYKWAGTEDVILLVHGWESNASRWKKLIPYLKKTGKTIIAIDAPGHGMSNTREFNVPVYSIYIEHIVKKYNPKTVIGHSIGGNTLAYYQQNFDHHFEKMILIGAPSDFEIILNNYFKILNLNKRIQKGYKKLIKEKFNIETHEFKATNFLSDTSLPGIIAHDKKDEVVLYEEAIKISNIWKTATLITTDGFGHSMHDEKLYKTIKKFIEQK